MPETPIRIALVGNPNAGKSTLFNALSGLRQHVANYPGVTVEMKTGRFRHADRDYEVIDLPGTYSLAPRSPDEMVAVDLLLGRRKGEAKPDLIVAVVDASNLDRHLYLTTQLLELGLPVAIAVTMIDSAATRGIVVDAVKLAIGLKVPIVPVNVPAGLGIVELKAAIANAHGQPAPCGPVFPADVATEAQSLQAKLGPTVPAFLVQRLLFDVGGQTERELLAAGKPELAFDLAAARQRLEATHGPALEARIRYGWIRKATAAAVTKPKTRPVTLSDKLDRVLTHRIWGTLIFFVVMFLMFQSIFVWATPLMDLIDAGFTWFAEVVQGSMPPGALRSLITDGIIKGVGSVVIFLPQILILFGFIAVLEDCGYMARAAYLMDKIMRRCGLNGKSFIPLLSSTACAVPGIMATRVIENRRDRLATIVVAPLMSCSARLPVYALFIGTFLSDGFAWWVPGLTLFAMYMVGFLTAPITALILKRTLLRGETPLFLMELPNFKRPSLRAVLIRMLDAGRAFLVRAGTMILASMIVIWALLYFPTSQSPKLSYPEQIERIAAEIDAVPEGPEADEAKKAFEAQRDQLTGDWKRNSYLGRVGRALEPAFVPLGWDWKIGMAALASFPAREVLVGTFGIIYDVGDVDAGAIGDPKDDKANGLRASLQSEWQRDPVRGPYAVATAFSIMIFFALCCQCVSTLAVIRRETRSWSWPIFTFTYMTVLAYLGAWATYQLGKLWIDTMN